MASRDSEGIAMATGRIDVMSEAHGWCGGALVQPHTLAPVHRRLLHHRGRDRRLVCRRGGTRALASSSTSNSERESSGEPSRIANEKNFASNICANLDQDGMELHAEYRREVEPPGARHVGIEPVDSSAHPEAAESPRQHGAPGVNSTAPATRLTS